jgi:hypothetical protein
MWQLGRRVAVSWKSWLGFQGGKQRHCIGFPSLLSNGQKRSVDSVHTFAFGLARSAAELGRIPHVSGIL